eukprot:1818532-Lingulodinium_polyedra.AAC.1
MPRHVQSVPFSPRRPRLQGRIGQDAVGSKTHLQGDARNANNSSRAGHFPHARPIGLSLQHQATRE